MLWKKISQQKLLDRKSSTAKDRKSSSNSQLRTDPENQNLERKQKRKLLDTATKRERVKKKRKMRNINGVVEQTDIVDRISELPEPLIHHILSFLRCPKDVTRASVLSKKWRSAWASFLTFDFDQKSFKSEGGVQQAEFRRFIERSLSTRIAPLVCIQKFRLHMTFDSKLAHQIDRWLRAATAKNIKELEIYIERKKRRRYTLPQIVFVADTLTSLKLYGCKLSNCNDIKLPKLQQLSMKKMKIEADIIQRFIRSCPNIEDLRLIHCDGLECLHVSTLLKLNRVEVHECHGLQWVEIEAPNLQTFWCYAKRSKPCDINLKCCENLKSLTLKDTNMADDLFHDLISKFPVLEKLILMECNTLERITILSRSLERLVLIRCKKLLEAIVDAPNLYSFEYTGDKTFSFSMRTPKLQDAKLYFEPARKGACRSANDQHTSWLVKMQEFLGQFDQSENLKLVVRRKKDMLISEELRNIHLPPDNELKLEILNPSTNLEDLLDSLLRATHPVTLSVVSLSDSEFLKLIREKVMNREENPTCCRYYSRKCWRHYLNSVKVGDDSSVYPWIKSSSTLHKTTTFKLGWTAG